MEGLAELHTHLGGSVASDILWSLAHEQGIALPVKDYWEFDRLVTVSDPRGVANLNAPDEIYHWTELIQSSPIAVERSVHAAIGGAYRSQGITTLELRFNPMKRNRGGERDLDHIILAAIRGLDRASLEYPQVRAGLILMMDRTFSAELNSIIVEKAIGWAPRGIVGVDIAGPRPDGGRYDYKQVAPRGESAWAGGEFTPGGTPRPQGVAAANTPFGQWSPRAWPFSFDRYARRTAGLPPHDHRAAAPGHRAHRRRVLERRSRRAPGHLPSNGEGPFGRPAAEARCHPTPADPSGVPSHNRRPPARAKPRIGCGRLPGLTPPCL